jgi:hypothetical protein
VSIEQLPNVGITAGTYGNATTLPAVTINSRGLITSVSNVAIAGGFSDMNVITTTQTWTIPAGVTKCKVTVVGGGGGGGGFGPGGTGGTSNVASGTQVITPFILATGGTGGRYPGSGAGGTATGGTLNIVGGPGGAGGSYSGGSGIDAGEGGSSIFGGGAPTGEPSNGAVPRVSATGFGGGGSGQSTAPPYGGSGGGGGGGAAIRYLTNLTPGNTLTVTIGTGGAGSEGGAGGVGDGFQGVVVIEY